MAEVTVEWNIYCSLLMFFSATLETKANIHKSPYSQCSNTASLTGQQFNQGGFLTDWCAHPESFLDTSAAEMSSFSPMQRSQMTIGLLCQKHQKNTQQQPLSQDIMTQLPKLFTNKCQQFHTGTIFLQPNYTDLLHSTKRYLYMRYLGCKLSL